MYCLRITFVGWGWVAHLPQLRMWVAGSGTMAYSRTLLPNPSGRDSNKQVRGMSCAAPTISQYKSDSAPWYHRLEGDDSIYLAPEETQKDAPPSYASAQADAVPPYWETTTIHLPSGVSASSVPGEMIIEGLPTGTLFSFMWNMLVSISFQFVGFLLTFLLHTTHAAKFGSRAGLGITLIQYGFALRTKMENVLDGSGYDSTDGSVSEGYPGLRHTDPTRPSFETAAEADAYYKTHPPPTTRQDNYQMNNGTDAGGIYVTQFSDSTSEWISFFLMTVGERFSRAFVGWPAYQCGYRVVHPPDFRLVLLEGQEMGAWYPRLF